MHERDSQPHKGPGDHLRICRGGSSYKGLLLDFCFILMKHSIVAILLNEYHCIKYKKSSSQ